MQGTPHVETQRVRNTIPPIVYKKNKSRKFLLRTQTKNFRDSRGRFSSRGNKTYIEYDYYEDCTVVFT